MKKALLLCFVMALIFSACKKSDDYVFKQTPDERVNAALASYQATLAGAANGWKAFITVRGDSGATYSFYFKFSGNNTVNMVSDFDSLSAVTLQQSSYRLKAEQQPTLIFDTYSYVHVLADPNEATYIVQANVNGGPVGLGLLSDFAFIIDSSNIKADSIVLRGKVNQSKLLLIKATKAEEDAYNSGALALGLSINKILTYFRRLTVGSQLYDIRFDPFNRRFIFSWLESNGNLKTFSTGFYYTAGGIVFNNPLVNGNQTISGFSNITWNPASETISLIAGGSSSTITGVVIPLKIDVGAPSRWWNYAINNGGNYWISVYGFHVNGIDDAFGVNTLASGTSIYYYLLYWPKVTNSNDFFGPAFLNGTRDSVVLIYGTAPRFPTFTADGRAVFQRLGDYGPPNFLTYPATGPAALTKNLLFNANGYYFVQTGEVTYDMVSASNGKSWLTWQWIF